MQLHRRIRWYEFVLKIVAVVVLVINLLLFSLAIFINSDFFISLTTPGPSEDTVAPVISLNGSETLRVSINSSFEDPGVTAFDTRTEVIISRNGSVDTSSEGDYTIEYTACDENNNCSSINRTVKVIKPAGTIYLTFDDGPGEHTGRLLDVLKKYGVHATFFVTGRGADELLKREHDEGHSIGLHSFSHDYSYIYRNTANFWEDMEKVRARVQTATGEDTLLMRFPGGSSNTVSARYDGGSHIMSKLTKEATERGYTYFDWNVLSGDAGETTDTNQIIENVTKALKPGGASVVLQHDIKDFSVDAVEGIIQYGLENNYFFEKLTPNSFNAHHGVNN